MLIPIASAIINLLYYRFIGITLNDHDGIGKLRQLLEGIAASFRSRPSPYSRTRVTSGPAKPLAAAPSPSPLDPQDDQEDSSC